MVFVKIRDNESIEEALRRFKRECERNGVLKEIKRREHYTPPSLARKLKQAGQWNRLRVLANHTTIQVHLNGRLLEESTGMLSKLDLPSSGAFALEPEGEMDFANMFVRELK